MNLRDDDVVSAVALVMETNTSAQVQAEIATGPEDTIAGAVEGSDGDAPAAAAAPDEIAGAESADGDSESEADE
jgi:hypothetical protein